MRRLVFGRQGAGLVVEKVRLAEERALWEIALGKREREEVKGGAAPCSNRTASPLARRVTF